MGQLLTQAQNGCYSTLIGTEGQVVIFKNGEPVFIDAGLIPMPDDTNCFSSNTLAGQLAELCANGGGGGGGGSGITLGAEGYIYTNIAGSGVWIPGANLPVTIPGNCATSPTTLGLALDEICRKAESAGGIGLGQPWQVYTNSGGNGVWLDLGSMAVTDPNNLYGSTNLVGMLQEVMAIASSGSAVNCTAVLNCISTASFAGDSIIQASSINNTLEVDLSRAPIANLAQLQAGLQFVFADQGNGGTYRAQVTDVADYLCAYLDCLNGGTPIYGTRTWVKSGNVTETSATSVLPSDNIWHSGKVRIGPNAGASAIGAASPQLENNGAFVNGDTTGQFVANGITTGSQLSTTDSENSILNGKNLSINVITGGSFVGGYDITQLNGIDGGIVAGTRHTGAGVNNSLLVGDSNAINDIYNSLIAGEFNTVSSLFDSIVAGDSNTVSGNRNIVSGINNRATSNNGVAFGVGAQTLHADTFTWASDAFISTVANQFNAQASGGFRFRTNAGATVGVDLPAGASAWVAVSSETTKDLVDHGNTTDLLDAVAGLPLWRYRYKGAERINYGTTGEAWHELADQVGLHKDFIDIGGDAPVPGISQSDQIGVLMASMQQLIGIVKEQGERIAALEEQISIWEGAA